MWFMWSVVFALGPYAAASVVHWLNGGGVWPGPALLIGAGQLLLTAVGLLASGLKELTQAVGTRLVGPRWFLVSVSALVLMLLGVVYGSVAAAELQNPGSIDAELVVTASVVAYVGSLLAAGAAIVITDPRLSNPLGPAPLEARR